MSDSDLFPAIKALTEEVRHLRHEMRDRPIVGALNMAQACKYLGVCEMTIRRLITRGDLRSRLIGTARRWRISDLDDYLDRCIDTRGAALLDPETARKRINEITGA